MGIVYVPYHHDERQPDSSIPVRSEAQIHPVTPALPEGDLVHRLTALFADVADEVEADVKRGSTPVVLSGDCLVSMGVLTGLQRAGIDPAVVWFDAHGDVHTVESSSSGYLGGMSLRFLLGANYDLFGEKLGFRPLPENRAVLVDARDLDPAEAEYLRASQVKRCPVDHVELPDGPLIVHVDADVIDAGEVPRLRFPVGNGPSKKAVLEALRAVKATGRVVAMDIACPWDPADELESTRAELVGELVG
ncbi:arginase family protein [Kibdelosporangium aridum]|uniref:Arginase family protein n=1 Tax=Kibdelosporangium aridum TaxID=2030 RepID=A0A428Z6X6_KIBAR|nr:arginase family protein [Kibdelosporangium aridum]RSM83131.1 arginase family protein [Kibdelosporangium aridum]